MPMYTVVAGDCLSSIAEDKHLPDWRTIYNHANNAAFRALRPDPNVIFPGDELFVPEPEDKSDPAPTDQYHTYKANVRPVMLRIVLLDEDLKPMPSTNYTLKIGETPITGRTDGSGLLEHPIAASLSRATLESRFTRDGVDTGYTWELHLGELDPDSEMTGIQARLNNLGYNTGPIDGIKGPRTTDAVRQFQEKYKLTIDGIPGPITRRKLVEVHGC